MHSDNQWRLSRRRLFQAGLGLAASAGLPGHVLAAPACEANADWKPPAWLLDDLPRQMQALGVPGVGIALVTRGELVWSQGFGVADVAGRVAVDDETLFEAASLSKPVFAYAVLQLVDRGDLALNASLLDYVRPDYLGDSPWLAQITVRDVLRHSAGLPNWRKDPVREHLVPAVAPGKRIDYSGEAFFWLQLVMEKVTGESLDQTMQRLLFKPAGMHDSSYGWDAALAKRSVYGYRSADEADAGLAAQGLREDWEVALPIAERWGTSLSAWCYADAQRALPLVQAAVPEGTVNWAGDIVANAAASLRCTVADYARFAALLVRDRREAWELHPATRAAMQTRQIVVPGRWSDKTLGLNLEHMTSGPVLYHSGSNADIFKTFMLADPQRQHALVVMSNASNGNLLYRRIVRASTGLDLLAFDA